MAFGGPYGDEHVNCVLDDKLNKQILIAGNSTSGDFAPTNQSHGFSAAIDYDGNWKWGHFFYNISYRLSTISGCYLNADNRLVLLGLLDDHVAIVEQELKGGTIVKSLYLDNNRNLPRANWPKIVTYNAIYHEVAKRAGQRSYYYVAFISNDQTWMVKIDADPSGNSQPARHQVVWSFFYEFTGTTAATAWKNKKTPRFLHQDLRESDQMYLIGRYYGKASVIKFSKTGSSVDYRLAFHCYSGATNPVADDCCRTSCLANSNDIDSTGSVPMSDILSYVQPEGQAFIYACGFAFQDMTSESDNRYASMFKMSTDGTVEFIRRWGQYRNSPPYPGAADVCRSISYDSSSKELVMLLDGHSQNLRPRYRGWQNSYNYTDMVIVRMSESGTVNSMKSISYGNLISVGAGTHTMFIKDR